MIFFRVKNITYKTGDKYEGHGFFKNLSFLVSFIICIHYVFILLKPRQNNAKYVILKPPEFTLDIYAIICLKYLLMKPKIKSCRTSWLTEKNLNFFTKFTKFSIFHA